MLMSALIIFLSTGVFALGESCFITDRATCEASGTIVMGLSGITNAHGELASEGNYGSVLCCNFVGSLTCDSSNSNKIIRLSSSTNAHAEIPDQTTYTTNVCYENLNCISTSQNCGDITESPYTPIFSLSNFTNAHIGGINDYPNIRICCTSPSFVVSSSNVFWSSNETIEISQLDVIPETTSVKMVLETSGLSQGTEVSFNILEEDFFLNADDKIRHVDNGNAITATIDANGDAIANWTITLEDLEKTASNDYDEFYFEVNNEISNYLTLNILNISVCEDIVICGNYENEVSCGNDICQVAGTDAPTNVTCDDPTINCQCSWTDQCNFEFESQEVNGTVIGTCTFVENTEDDCSDGLLSYSWITTWTEDLGDKPLECSDGSRVLECPAQIQLPFFGFYNLIVAVLLIAIIYFIILRRKD